MSNLKTKYMGLELNNPIIVSSSKLTGTLENLLECEKNMAGAVVLKSIFEEQLMAQTNSAVADLDVFQHADAYDFFNKSTENYFMNEYLKFIEDAKKTISIPVIASLNCVSSGNWIEYASRIEAVGADALELNMYILPADAGLSSSEIEAKYLDVVKKLKNKLKIPVALKIGSNFSGMANFFKKLDTLGLDGIVLFNRFYNLDFNIEKEILVAGKIFSQRNEIYNTLRWTALSSGELNADIAANTGIHSGEDVIKMLLAGAKAVEICSAFYEKGLGHIKTLQAELRDWMIRHDYSSIDQFCGKLCQERSVNPSVYERAQYIKAITGLE
ncbi:MAG: dihydroorotate dehydrogenase-like protein [Spirochaetales bacterium]|nr:dihydroorotate dehydrogenase-like protein [Spirochaetales bacterium]